MYTVLTALTAPIFSTPHTGSVISKDYGLGSVDSTKTMNDDGSKTFKTILSFASEQTESTERTTKVNLNGTRTISGISTDVDGKTISFSETITINEDGGTTITGTRTNENGKTLNYTQTTVINADGTESFLRTQTDVATGEIITTQRTVTTDADGVRTITGTKQYPNGKVETFSGTQTIGEGSRKKDLTFTDESGRTRHVYAETNSSEGIRTDYKAETNFAGVTQTELDVYITTETPAAAA